MKKFIIISSLFIISFIIIYFFLGSNNYSKLIINEVSSNNDSYDYIELYNGYNYDINLEGYKLTDNELDTDKWTFGDITIKKKAYLVIYASGNNKCNEIECHTNFKLSNNGEVVMLLDKDNNLLSKISYEGMYDNMSYGYNGYSYVYYKNGTPGYENTGKYSKSILKNNNNISIYINEYMTKNKNTLIDNYGEYSDYIELYNYGNDIVNLEGYYLSDDINKLDKYMLPDININSGEYLIIYLSGLNIVKDNYIHTNFKLSDDDKYLILSNGDNLIIDKVDIVKLDSDMSYGRKDNEMCYFMKGTPGYSNDVKCFKEVSLNE